MSWSDFIWKSYELMNYKSISPIEIYPFSRAIGIIIFLEEVDLHQPLLKMCIWSIYYVKCSWKSISRVAPERVPNRTFIGRFLNTTSSKIVGSPKNYLCSNVFFSGNAFMHASHGNRNMKMKTILHAFDLYSTTYYQNTRRPKPPSVYTILPHCQDVKSCYQRILCVVYLKW
jgi:hypothetical protein